MDDRRRDRSGSLDRGVMGPVHNMDHYNRDEHADYRTAMFTAIRTNNYSEVKRLLEAKPRDFYIDSLDPRGDIDSLDPRGDTFLHFAVRLTRIDIARMLIRAGADVNKRSERDPFEYGLRYPILYSAAAGDLPMVKLLIENGAHKEVQTDRRGLTPFLEVVGEATHWELLEYLGVEARVNYRAVDRAGRNAFDILRDISPLRQQVRRDIDSLKNCLAVLIVLFRGDPRYAVGVVDGTVEGGIRFVPVAEDFGLTDEELVDSIQYFSKRLGSSKSRLPAVARFWRAAAAGGGAAAPAEAGAGAGAAAPAAAGAGAAGAPVGPRAFEEWANKQRTAGRRRKTQRRRARRSRRVKQRTLRRRSV